jgi:FAD/FMN-containing dehydrogenase
MTTALDSRTPTGEPLPPGADGTARLRQRLAGPTLAPGEEGYDEARRIWNHMIDRRPALIARPADTDDVAACLDLARRQGMAVTVRGGGHNIGGLAVADGALMLDFSERREVRVDPAALTAEVSPGATLGDVDRATQQHGLALPAGIMSETGVAGLTLGGGFGWLSRRWGLTCDHLLSAEVVTADGETVTADAESHPDLYWALRGGGGGFGVVTSFRFGLRELGTTVTAGMVVHRGDDAAEAMDRFRRRTEELPDELTCQLRLGNAPPAPFLPAELHGRPATLTAVCHSGAAGDVEADLEPLRATATAVADVVTQRPFVQFQGMFDAGEPKGRRDYWKSEYIDRLDDRLAAHLLDQLGRLPSTSSNIKIFRLGGAVSRVPAGSTAAGHRDAGFIVAVASAWDRPEDDDANVSWVRECWSRVHELSGRGGYVNFLTADSSPEQVRAAYGGVDFERLDAIRRRYDPQGLLAPRRDAN